MAIGEHQTLSFIGSAVHGEGSCQVALTAPDDGIKNLTQEDAVRLAGEVPDYHIKDMFNAIESGNYPSWTMCLQIMNPKEAETYRWNIFDITKVWPHKDYPLVPVGRLTLNRNPQNHFQEVEQAAFSPSNMVSGIGPSADTMLHARRFSYPMRRDTALDRTIGNYPQKRRRRCIVLTNVTGQCGSMGTTGVIQIMVSKRTISISYH
jgi:catalase